MLGWERLRVVAGSGREVVVADGRRQNEEEDRWSGAGAEADVDVRVARCRWGCGLAMDAGAHC